MKAVNLPKKLKKSLLFFTMAMMAMPSCYAFPVKHEDKRCKKEEECIKAAKEAKKEAEAIAEADDEKGKQEIRKEAEAPRHKLRRKCAFDLTKEERKQDIQEWEAKLEKGISDAMDRLETYRYLSCLYQADGNCEKAIEYSIKAMKLRRQINESGELAIKDGRYDEDRFHLMGILEQEGQRAFIVSCMHANIENYEEAISTLEKALAMYEDVEDVIEKGFLWSLKGAVYAQLVKVHRQAGNYAKAIEYAKKALAEAEQIENKEVFAFFYGQLGALYEEEGNYSEAFKYYGKVVDSFAEACEDKALLGGLLKAYESKLEYLKQLLDKADEAKD